MSGKSSNGNIPKSLQLLDGTQLKLIAMVSMVFDHLGDNFFPGQIWMRIIGRMAMPLFSFCIAEGFCHTHDRTRYLTRMLVFGAVSEIPFDLVTSGRILETGHQNIMLTFSWAVLGLICLEAVLNRIKKRAARYIAAGALIIAFMAGSIFLRMDYTMTAVLLISVFYLMRNKLHLLRTCAGAAAYAALRNVGIHIAGLLGFVPILFYNGKRGKGLKWLFYLFYPGHLLLIYLIKRIF
ncbi:MAG: hypothetical protein J5744_05410 [Oscillospiraceae bacterium]|nr:hypothetical protein [Oscillospiraceae bacterium]